MHSVISTLLPTRSNSPGTVYIIARRVLPPVVSPASLIGDVASSCQFVLA